MERSSTISSGRSCCELSRLPPFHSRLPRTRQGPLRVGSVRRAPCESTDCHPRSEQIYRSGSVAFSCLASCGFLICSDLNFNLGPLFEASLFLSHPSTYSQCEFPDTDHRLRQCWFPLFRAVSDKQA